MRTFIAIDISEEIKQKLAKLQEDLPADSRIRPVKSEAIHITLKFLGEIENAKVTDIKRVIDSIKFDPFAVDVTGIGVFPSETFIRVVWVGAENEGLDRIAAELDKGLQPFGFGSEKFVSHLTIARVTGRIDPGDFLSKHKYDYFGRFEVKEIKLKRSTLTPRGPIYEDL